MFKKLIAAAVAAAFFVSAPAFGQAVQAPMTSLTWFLSGKISGGINVTAASAQTTLPAGGDTAWVCNTGANDAYVALGAGVFSATTTGSSLLKAGTCWGYSKKLFGGGLATSIAAITASSTTTLTLETGVGTPPFQLSSGGGSTTANQGTPASLANAWSVKITDATNGPAAVKAANVTPTTSDPALVVSIAPASNGLLTMGTAGSPSAQVMTAQGIAGGIGFGSQSDYPVGASPITASATGTTAATAATLAGVASKTTYICGFSIRANATAAATGNATVAGTISGTLNFTQWTAPLATGIGITEPPMNGHCIPASAVNTGIVITSAAPGAGGVVSVSAWGYQL